MVKKVVIICHNYEPDQFPKEPDTDNRFYTYGFGSGIGRQFKKYFSPDYIIEVWRVDGYVNKYYENEFDGIKFRVFPSFHKKNIFDFSFKFLRELKKETKKTDPLLFVVHTHIWLTYQVAFFFRKSIIVTTHHGEWSPFYRLTFIKGLRKIKAYLDIFFEKISFKNIDCILTIDKKQIPYFERVNPKIKFYIWSHGIDFETMKPIPKIEARKMLGWDVNKKYIFYVGKLYKYKQVDVLINIWKEIQKERPEVELIIAGNAVNDPWEEYYDLTLNSGALLLGRVLNVELHKYYSASDVYVLMALRDDYFGGTGISTLEALACNTPVVSYALRNYIGEHLENIGEIPETIEDTKNAILKVIDHPENYKFMRESVQKAYSIEAMVKRAEKIFESLFENKTNYKK